MTDNVFDEIVFRIRQYAPVTKKMHDEVRSYPESLRTDLVEFFRAREVQAAPVKLAGEAIAQNYGAAFIETLIAYYDHLTGHERYSADHLVHLLTAYRKQDWFNDVTSGRGISEIAAMVKNSMTIIETALWNWELPEVIDEATMDNGNLRYVRRSSHGIALFEMTDPQLIKMVLDHPEHTDWIESFLVQRRTIDYSFISSMLFSETTALSSGTL